MSNLLAVRLIFGGVVAMIACALAHQYDGGDAFLAWVYLTFGDTAGDALPRHGLGFLLSAIPIIVGGYVLAAGWARNSN